MHIVPLPHVALDLSRWGLPPARAPRMGDDDASYDDVSNASSTPVGTVTSAIVNAGSAYPVDFTCTLGDNKREPSGAAAYIHGDEIVILPNFEHLADGLMSRSRDSRLRVTIPASVLKAGSYHVTLVGEHASRSWTLQVH